MYNITISPSIASSLSTGGRSSIASAKIRLETPLKGNKQLSISFLDRMNIEISRIDFEFIPLNTDTISGNLTSFFHEIMSKKTYKIADMYPLNGTVKNGNFNISNYVRQKHRGQIQQHVVKLNDSNHPNDFVRLMVIDFKDSNVEYHNRDEISKTEQAFANFLINTPPTNKKANMQIEIHALIRKNEINFLINEGTLKADLLRYTFFEMDQRAFFEDKNNSALFCQLCEVLMNGFKQGLEVVANGIHYHPNNYIRALNPSNSAYIGHIPVNPFLQTYYPENYKDTYSESSMYYKLIHHTSTVGYQYDNVTGITTITVQ